MVGERRTPAGDDGLAEGREQVTNSPLHRGCGERHRPFTPCPGARSEALTLATAVRALQERLERAGADVADLDALVDAAGV